MDCNHEEILMLKITKKYSAIKFVALSLVVLPLLAACGNGGGLFGKKSNINTTTKFSSSEYGVAASKRVTTSSKVKKGGGRAQVGKPYKVAGKWYTPKVDENYDKTGVASWYGPNFHGRQTANGEIFDQYAISAAHPTLPLPSYVRVTNLENNKSIVVRVNDRGPFSNRRIIDLSKRVADILGVIQNGTARVRVRYVGKAPLEGDDTRMLMASINNPTSMERGGGVFSPRVQVASISAPKPKILNNRNPSNSSPIIVPFVNPDNSLGPLFYAKDAVSSQKLDGAFAAVNAMATRASDLEGWRNSIDLNARKIQLELGVFSKNDGVERIISAFALIGAVEETKVELRAKPATKLTLTHLKLGATRKDALDIARRLGLKDIILYE